MRRPDERDEHCKAGGRGDLYVHVRIMLPEAGDPALEEFFRKRKGI